jgi:hypothetical protein
MTAPEKIWVEEPEIFDGMGFWQERQSADLIQYTRTDTIPDPLDDPRVVALVEACTSARDYFNGSTDTPFQVLAELTKALSAITKEPPHER